MKYKFFDQLFYVNVWLLVGDRKNFDDKLGKEDDNSTEAATYSMYDEAKGVARFYVWIKDNTRYYNMVHETLHLVHRILNHIGIRITNEENQIEFLAYYQNYWVRKFWHKMSNFVKE